MVGLLVLLCSKYSLSLEAKSAPSRTQGRVWYHAYVGSQCGDAIHMHTLLFMLIVSLITITGGNGYSVLVYSHPSLQYGTQSSTPFCWSL